MDRSDLSVVTAGNVDFETAVMILRLQIVRASLHRHVSCYSRYIHRKVQRTVAISPITLV